MARNEYYIILRNETLNAKNNAVAGQYDDRSKDTSPKTDNGDFNGKKTFTKGFVAYKHYVEPFVKQAISYEISTVSVRTGRTEEQQRRQFAYDMGSKIFSAAESIAMGAILGGLPGALIGLGMSAVQMIVSYSQAQNTIDINRNAENISIGLQNMRAGGSVASYNNSRGQR